MSIILVIAFCLISFILGGVAFYFLFNKDIDDRMNAYLRDICKECRYKELVEWAVEENNVPVLNKIRKDLEDDGYC